jgi:hypothetical protein
MVELWVSKTMPFESMVGLSVSFRPHCDLSAFSYRFRITRHRHRQMGRTGIKYHVFEVYVQVKFYRFWRSSIVDICAIITHPKCRCSTHSRPERARPCDTCTCTIPTQLSHLASCSPARWLQMLLLSSSLARVCCCRKLIYVTKIWRNWHRSSD